MIRRDEEDLVEQLGRPTLGDVGMLGRGDDAKLGTDKLKVVRPVGQSFVLAPGRALPMRVRLEAELELGDYAATALCPKLVESAIDRDGSVIG